MSVLIGHQRNDVIMNMQIRKKCQWFLDNRREEQANSSVSWKIQSKESIAQDSMLKKYCSWQFNKNVGVEFNSMQRICNQWWDKFIPIVVLPYCNIYITWQIYWLEGKKYHSSQIVIKDLVYTMVIVTLVRKSLDKLTVLSET